MTQAKRSIADVLDDHVTTGFYATILLACVAFAGMLVAPDAHAERMLSLAWVFMVGAMVCLAARLGLELIESRQVDASEFRTPQQ